MIRTRVVVCDICGQETHDLSGSLIVKRRWHVFDGAGWSRCDICSDCAELLYDIAKEKKMPNEESEVQ